MTLTTKQKAFYTKWENRRKSKPRYLFLHGFLAAGFLLGSLLEMLNNGWNFSEFHMVRWLLFVAGLSLLGIWNANAQFKRIDKDYWQLKDKNLL